MLNLFFQVCCAVIENADIGSLAFLFLVHLLCHACLNLLRGSLIALDSSLEAQREWGIDFDGDINSVLKARLEKERALLSNDGCRLPFSPLLKVSLDYGMMALT